MRVSESDGLKAKDFLQSYLFGSFVLGFNFAQSKCVCEDVCVCELQAHT